MPNVIVLPTNLNSFSLEEVYHRASRTKNDGVVINARKLEKFSFGGLCGLVALARLYSDQVSFELPDYANVSVGLLRHGFFHVTEDYLRVNGTIPEPLEVLTVDPRFTPMQSIGFPGRGSDFNEYIPQAIVSAIASVREISAEMAGRISELLARALSGVAERCKLVPPEFVGQHAIGWVTAGITYGEFGKQHFSLAIVDLAQTALQTVGAVEGVTGSAADQSALETLLFPGRSKPGPDQFGYLGLRRTAAQQNGLMSLRSGTACIRVLPAWSDLGPIASDLAYFPGVQIGMTLPKPD